MPRLRKKFYSDSSNLTLNALHGDGSFIAGTVGEDKIDGHGQLPLTEVLWVGTEKMRQEVLDTNFIQVWRPVKSLCEAWDKWKSKASLIILFLFKHLMFH